MRASLIVIVFVACGLAVGSHFLSAGATGVADFDKTNAIAARYGQATSAMYIVNEPFEHLAQMRAFTERLKNSGACKTVLSFFSLPVIVSHDDETEIADLVTGTDGPELKAKALLHPNGKGELLSDDGSRALVICPMLKEPEPGDRVDPATVMQAVASDMRLGAGLFGVAGLLVLGSIRRKALAPRGSAVVALLMLMFLADAWWANPAGNTLGRLLGPGASALLAKLNQVTHADRTLLVDVTVNANTAAGLRELTDRCAALQPLGDVRCPTAALQMMGQALTGATALPSTGEQVKALWFFGGDRPELAMLFTADKQHALIRVIQKEAADVEVTDAGGVPLITARDFLVPALAVLLLGFVLGLKAPASLELVLGFGALAVPVGLVAWPLAIAAVGLGGGGALAARLKTREGAAL